MPACAQCGTDFINARSDAAYCSSACRQRAYRNRNRPNTIRNTSRVTPNRNTPPVTDTERERFAQYKAECDAKVLAYKAKLDANFAAYKAQLDQQSQVMRKMRDEERQRYQLGIEVHKAKGLISPEDYSLIRSCLHPDSRMSATDQKLAAAFRVFNDPKIKVLLVKEPKKKR